MSDAEKKVVVGEYAKIEEKSSGWYDVHVNVPGKQYPVRLSTKSSAMLDSVRATQGKTATFTFVERESTKINPNSGNPYINRFLEEVTPGAAAGATAGGSGGDSERMTKAEWDAKDMRDFRSRAWAQTISAFAHTIKSPSGDFNDLDVLAVFAKLKPFQRKLYEDIVQELATREQPQQQTLPETPPTPPAPDEPPPPETAGGGYPDDDIPFAPAIF